jgi:hypothetical protein
MIELTSDQIRCPFQGWVDDYQEFGCKQCGELCFPVAECLELDNVFIWDAYDRTPLQIHKTEGYNQLLKAARNIQHIDHIETELKSERICLKCRFNRDNDFFTGAGGDCGYCKDNDVFKPEKICDLLICAECELENDPCHYDCVGCQNNCNFIEKKELTK